MQTLGGIDAESVGVIYDLSAFLSHLLSVFYIILGSSSEIF